MLSRFKKATAIPSEEQLAQIKHHLKGLVWTEHDDFLSTYAGRQLNTTLGSVLNPQTYQPAKFNVGDPLPYGYSLAYCNPIHPEHELGTDGYDNFNSPTLNNEEFFTRRLWVAGEMRFPPNRLHFGDQVSFKETVSHIKSLDQRRAMFIDYNREFTNQNGLAQVEKRCICYLYGLYSPGRGEPSDTKPDRSVTIKATEITNARVSGLTFNAHLLHYDPSYCTQVEGYPRPVLQAPLLSGLALQFWTDQFNAPLKRVKYKVSSPLFIDEKIKLCVKQIDQQWKLWIENEQGMVCYRASLT